MTLRATAAALALLLAAAGCGGSSTAAPTTRHHGTVAVLYAGSLVNLMEHGVGPAFDAATGYTFEGFAGGSTELAHEITGKVRRGDVFISASPKVTAALLHAGGDWESWYASFASAPLVLAYNPKSAFAAKLRDEPWYQALSEPGIKVGRTDPTLDPKGKLTITALHAAAAAYHDPGLAGKILANTQVFPETELVGRLEAGQLDAGFFYANEAKENALPTVSLGAVHEKATYTLTALNHAPDAAGAAAFVRFLLGPQGRALLTQHGLTVLTPAVAGNTSAVPKPLRSVLTGG